MQKIFAIVLICVALIMGCEGMKMGKGEGSFKAEAKAEVKYNYNVDWKSVPIAKLPPKYAQWKMEADAYLKWVIWNIEEIKKVRGGIAALFKVSADADANTIARAIRDTVKVNVKLVVEAKAGGTASAGMTPEQAHAEASGEAFAKIEWKTETTIDPDIKNKLDQVRGHIRSLVQIKYVISTMEQKGNELSNRGMKLHAEAITDLAQDPTLIVHSEQIQKSLEDGSNKCLEADARIRTIKADTISILNALEATFK